MQRKKQVETFLAKKFYWNIDYELAFVQANLQKLILDKYNHDPVDYLYIASKSLKELLVLECRKYY
jgi:hypothetical protein